MNPRPLGYEPNELPDCSTPRHESFESFGTFESFETFESFGKDARLANDSDGSTVADLPNGSM